MRLLIALLLSLPSMAVAQKFLTNQTDTLAKVGPFRVVVDPIDPETSKTLDIRTSSVQTAVELRLRSLGLPVTSSNSDSEPYLWVRLDHVCSDNGVACARSVIVSFHQVVNLKGSQCYANTWSISVTGIAGLPSAKNTWNTFLMPGVDTFANAYLEANPKK